MRRNCFQIAIDGPVAAGKSTVAALLAEKLKFLYVDTGAMYRAAALSAKRMKVDWNDEGQLAEMLKKIMIELEKPGKGRKDGRKVTVYLNGEDVSLAIRTQEIGEGASVISQYPKVRKILVKRQQEIVQGQKVIMEGRDIGLRVLPEADLKIYLDADLETRVRRKRDYLVMMGEDKSYAEVKKDVLTRDSREMTRKTDPLRPAEGAWIFDTSGLGVEKAVNIIIGKIKKLEDKEK